MRTTISLVLAGVAALAAACGGPVASPSPGTSTPPPPTGSSAPSSTVAPADCGQTLAWGTGQKEAPAQSTDALFEVRAGRHDCYDRVVFDIAGPAEAGYFASYVPVVTADGSGQPVPVPGTALQVVVRAPAQGFDSSGAEVFARTGDYLYTESQLAGWQSLRAIRFAGFFEGQCTIAVGVSAMLPFQVSTQLDPANHTRKLVLDIAHP
ncbi:AMIN-like domain-containing (lipo)protein [Actinophytocola sp.]|uniref:AMIN-like domain-containing (lipo)protein n=1 Tax=Actinophytocola sp. TaxID=1872138 RepID=UPI002D8085A7|nr:hypothetical protein [Actinophytocola sp.]HET9143265.1 hypothetical protein [Actinophytocola sp.]